MAQPCRTGPRSGRTLHVRGLLVGPDGTPFACFEAQRYTWGERTDALALVHQAMTLADEIALPRFDYHAINLKYISGLLGAVVLVIGVVVLLRATIARLRSPSHGRSVSPFWR